MKVRKTENGKPTDLDKKPNWFKRTYNRITGDYLWLNRCTMCNPTDWNEKGKVWSFQPGVYEDCPKCLGTGKNKWSDKIRKFKILIFERFYKKNSIPQPLESTLKTWEAAAQKWYEDRFNRMLERTRRTEISVANI